MQKIKSFTLALGLVLTGCQADWPPSAASLSSQDTAYWKEYMIPQYQMTFRCPSEATMGIPDGLLGNSNADGRKEVPFDLGLRPEKSSFLITGVFYNFRIRFIIINETAKISPFYAKLNHWPNETPPIDFYPFAYQRDQDGLLLAIERLYFLCPTTWQQVQPIAIDGKNGLWMGGYDFRHDSERGLYRETIAVPLAANKILLVYAEHYKAAQTRTLLLEREIVRNVAASIVLK